MFLLFSKQKISFISQKKEKKRKFLSLLNSLSMQLLNRVKYAPFPHATKSFKFLLGY